MSQQINLYDPALRRRRELLTAGNLALTALALLLAMGGWGASVRSQVAALEAENQGVSPRVSALQDQKNAIDKQLATDKPDPRLEAELASARALAGLRGEIVAALKKGVGSESMGFAEYLRGLARQSQGNLWLTGFSVGEAGSAMEIRGRMTDPVLLPEYIRRLNAEKAFKGRSFSALNISAGSPAPASGGEAGAAPAVAGRAPFHEFVLIPALDPVGGGASPAADAATQPAKVALADLLPPEAARALGGAGGKAQEAKR